MSLLRVTCPLFLLSAALAQPACTYPKVLGDAPLDGETSSGTDTLDGPGTDTSDGPGTNTDAPGTDTSDGPGKDTDAPDPGTDTDAPDPSTGGEPTSECPQITDEAACLAAGCSMFANDVALYRLDDNQQCVLDEVVSACLGFPGGAAGGPDVPGSFYEKATGRATQFGTDWMETPDGWGDCDDPDAPPVCDCVGQCTDRQAEAQIFLEIDKPCNDASDCALAEATCYDSDTCGSVAVHKDSLDAWDTLHGQLQASNCCDGNDFCTAAVACENNRCVATYL